MRAGLIVVSAVSAGLYAMSGAAIAQSQSPPTYQADPSVYKVIFEDANFRVIEGTRAKGVKDKPHSHPLPSVIYNLTDCKTKTIDGDGKSNERVSKKGTVIAGPIIKSHTAENIGDGECKQLFVEKK